MAETKGLCPSCVNSIRCDTWAEWKCKVFEGRIYNYVKVTSCEYYKKRGKDFKESRCQCEDCLKNDILAEVEMGDVDDGCYC